MTRFFAIVPAAGSGSRFGAEMPKQYLPLAGQTVLFHTLAVLCANPAIEKVLVILAPDDGWWPNHDWSGLGDKLETIFQGGETRADSVLAGLHALSGRAEADDWTLVHDAARPCLSAPSLQNLLDELQGDPVGGILAVPVADTLKRDDGKGRIAATQSREGLWQAQTPQMFRYGLLLQALQQVRQVTDEAGAIEALGHAPRLVRGASSNLKVTYPADLELAGWILQGNAR